MENDADQDDLLANRVDTEPPIFRGCSSSELVALLLGAVAVWLPLSILLALMVGKIPYALAILAIGILGSVYFGAGIFQRVKRNRPDHYYVHAVQRFLHLRGLRRAPFVWRSGPWDVSRSR